MYTFGLPIATKPNKCLLLGEKGERIYDACSEKKDADYSPKVFTYMGSGAIISVDGRPYSSSRIMHFWEYTEEYKHLRRGYQP